jgi:hypothetical protein
MKYSHLSLTWFGDITSCAEEAQYARTILEPLIKGGAKVRLELLNSGMLPEELTPWWTETIPKLTQAHPGLIRINHCNPDKGGPNPFGNANILLTHWDTLDFPQSWIGHLSKYSEVWGSFFNENIITFIPGTDKIYKNFPVTIESYSDQLSPVNLPDIGSSNPVIFGVINQWNQKSNMHDLIIAYCVEFNNNDNVVLVIKTGANGTNTDPNQKAQIVNLVKSIKGTVNKPNLPKIVLIQDNLSELSLAKLVSTFNIYVSTNRGAALDNHFMRAISNGKIAIVPRTGIYTTANRILGTTNKQIRIVNSYKEPVVNSPGASPLDKWTRVDIDQLCKEMRIAYIDQQTSNSALLKKIESNKEIIKEKLSPDVVVDKIAKELEALMPVIKTF